MATPPPRRSVLTKADRAPGDVAVGVRAPLRPVPDPAPVEPAPVAPAPTVRESAPVAAPAAPQPAPTRVAAPVTEVKAVKRAKAESAWAAASDLSEPDIAFTAAQLLDGPVKARTMHLPAEAITAIEQLQFALDERGMTVSKGTLVSHALVFAYCHPDAWLHLVPPDGRRRTGETNLSQHAKQTSFGIPVAVLRATKALAWHAGRRNQDRAPARMNVMETALRWALGERDRWVDAAAAAPVVISKG